MALLDNRVLPNGMVPYEHQMDAAQVAFNKKRLLFAHDVGSGKTLSAIVAARMFVQTTPGGKVVIVAPASLVTNWERETQQLLDPIISSSGKIPHADDFGDAPLFLIVDEAHQYQSMWSKRTRQMIALSYSVQGITLLTATPIRNYPSNIFPLLKILQHPLGNNYAAFKRMYCGGKESGSSNLTYLHADISDSMIIGEKSDYLDLPAFNRVLMPIELHGVGLIEFNRVLEERRVEYRAKVETGEISKKGFHVVLINHLRQAASAGKSFEAIRLARLAMDNGEQVVVFANYNRSAHFINKHLAPYGSVLLNGSIPKHKRQALVDTFQAGEAKAFVMTSAGAAGLNLQRGTVFISVDRTWSPFDMIQAEGRIHRNGQKKNCVSIWLQDEIVDPWLDNMMLTKYRVAREVLYGKRDTMEGLGSPDSWAKDLATLLFGRD